MKILLANYRYFVSGGPERYMFNISDGLSGRGHEVIPFSIKYSRNDPTPFSRYFVDPPGEEDEVYFREQKLTPKTIFRSLSRLFYANDVEASITRLIKDTKPDVAYVLHYLRKLSPSLLVGLKRAGLPIIVRLSDFGMLCPQAHFFRNGAPCELCKTGNLIPSIRYKCVQDNYGISIINFLATQYHKARHYFDLIDMFVVTNNFMYQKMTEAGYPKNRLKIIPTYANFEGLKLSGEKETGLIVYVGRLEEIKGVHILISALHNLKNKFPRLLFQVKIFGDGNEVYMQRLKGMVNGFDLNNEVEFCGHRNLSEISKYLSSALVCVVPSIWYENLPNVILESYACGTPVLASNIGSLAECVDDDKTGYLFQAGNIEHLAERLALCLTQPEKLAEMGLNARNVAKTIYSEGEHLQKLETLFVELVRNKNNK
jgi:glycosyltransferase involved in cell wall biosynthesis